MTRSRAEDWASLWKVAPFLRALAGAARYEYLVRNSAVLFSLFVLSATPPTPAKSLMCNLLCLLGNGT